MANLIINSHILILEKTTFRAVPRIGLTKVAVVGHRNSESLQYGETIDNMMSIGDALRQIANNQILVFKRLIDNFSIDISEAFRLKYPILVVFEFSSNAAMINDSAIFVVYAQNIDEYVPHDKGGGVPQNFPSGANGFERIRIKFNAEKETNISYGKKMSPHLVQFIKSQKKNLDSIKKLIP